MENKNIHSQLKTAMQEAWEHVDLDKETVEQFAIPEPDLSFLEDLESKNKKPEKHHRLAKIAVFLIAVFLTSSALSLFMNSQASYGVKSLIQNVKHFFSENEPVVDENGVQSLVLTDWEDLSDGKEIAGTLYVPISQRDMNFRKQHLIGSKKRQRGQVIISQMERKICMLISRFS